MKKVLLSSVGVLFVVAILISGCGKSEDQKAEAPAVETKMVQQNAMPVQEPEVMAEPGMVETAAPMAEAVAEQAEPMTGQAVEAAKETGQETTGTVGGEMMEKPEIATVVDKEEKVAAEASEAAKMLEAIEAEHP